MNKKISLFYKIGRVILGCIFKIYYNPKIINKEYIPTDGPIIIAGNHMHLYDQFLTIIATKRGIHYMAKKEYFDSKKTAWFFKAAGCIRVDRTKKDPEAVNNALNVLFDGGAIGIFPEGTRNKTNAFLLPFKFGAVSIAKKSNALFVPFGITGDYKFRSKNLKITFGKPIDTSKLTVEEANELLYEKVKELLLNSRK